MPLRRALAKSKNMVSIRILQAVGAQNAQEWITRFGFDADKHPPYLTMALGAGSVTPMQMALGYAVFANGGYRINPYLMTKITDQSGKVLAQSAPPALDEGMRGIDARNAFVMTSLLQEVTRSGTAARAQATLKRADVYGKTGTTNDSIDTWFVGYQPTLTAAVWMGYDAPKKLGDRETGGGLSLPIWIRFMEHALKNVPVAEPAAPEGVINVNGEWMYDEYARGSGITTLGAHDSTVAPGPARPGANPGPTGAPAQTAPPAQVLPPADERKRILDLFKN
jgi:penicillin-binding protein 1A